MTPTAAHRTAAFTLVELLVVVGIISVLIGILLPVVGRANSAAKRTKCAAQLREIGNFYQMYLNDTGGILPRVNAIPSRQPPLNEFPSIVAVFEPYVKGNVRIWECPADKIMRPEPGTPEGFETYFEREGASYELNTFSQILYEDAGNPALRERKVLFKDFVEQAETRMRTSANRLRVFNDWEPFHGSPGKPGNRNFLFADWHVGDLE